MSNQNQTMPAPITTMGTTITYPAGADNQAMAAIRSLHNALRITPEAGDAINARLPRTPTTITMATYSSVGSPDFTTLVASPRLDDGQDLTFESLTRLSAFMDIWQWRHVQGPVRDQWLLVHVGYSPILGAVPPDQPRGAQVYLSPRAGMLMHLVHGSIMETVMLGNLEARGIEHPERRPEPTPADPFGLGQSSATISPFGTDPHRQQASTAGGGGGHGGRGLDDRGSSSSSSQTGKKKRSKGKKDRDRSRRKNTSGDEELGVDLGSPPKETDPSGVIRLNGGGEDDEISSEESDSSSHSSKGRGRKDVSQSHSIRTLDDVRVYGKTKDKLYDRLIVVQPILRLTSLAMQNKTIRDLVFRKSAVFSLLTAKMHNPMGSTTVGGFENLEQLPEVWDLPVFTTEETFSSFYLMKGWERGNYTLMSLRFFLKKLEKGIIWGDEHGRDGRALLLKAIERIEVCFTILYDPSYKNKMAPLQELSQARYSNHANGFIWYHVDDTLCRWCVCIREEHALDTPGFEGHLITHPVDCSNALGELVKDLMRRLGSKKYPPIVGGDCEEEIPPHRNFFAPEGPWAMVQGKGDQKASNPNPKGACLDWLANQYNLCVGPSSAAWSCKKSGCKLAHTGTKEEAWKTITKVAWWDWSVATSTKKAMADLIPNFDPAWE